jgi:hypothetical protein
MGINDIGGKFATGVSTTGAWGKLIHKKPEVENLVALPL